MKDDDDDESLSVIIVANVDVVETLAGLVVVTLDDDNSVVVNAMVVGTGAAVDNSSRKDATKAVDDEADDVDGTVAKGNALAVVDC